MSTEPELTLPHPMAGRRWVMQCLFATWRVVTLNEKVALHRDYIERMQRIMAPSGSDRALSMWLKQRLELETQTAMEEGNDIVPEGGGASSAMPSGLAGSSSGPSATSLRARYHNIYLLDQLESCRGLLRR